MLEIFLKNLYPSQMWISIIPQIRKCINKTFGINLPQSICKNFMYNNDENRLKDLPATERKKNIIIYIKF